MSNRLARAAAIAALSLAVFSSSADGATWESPVTVAPGAAEHADQPVVAADAAGNLTAIWAGAHTRRGVYTATRAAGAASWTTPALIARTDDFRPRDLRLAVSPAGQAVVAWTDAFSGTLIGTEELRLKSLTRTSNGTWSTNAAILRAPNDDSVLEDIVDLRLDHDLTIEPSGRLVGLWARGVEGELGGYDRIPGGTPSTVNAPATNAGTDVPPPFDLAIDANGTATAVFVGQGGQSILTATHPAGGTWSAPTILDQFAPEGADTTQTVMLPDLAVASDGQAVAAWMSVDPTGAGEIRAARRSAANSWTASASVQARGEFDVTGSLDTGIDATGRATVLYDFMHSVVVGETIQVWQEMRAASASAGGAWRTPVAVSSRFEFDDPDAFAFYAEVGLRVSPAGHTFAHWAHDGVLSAAALTADGTWEPQAALATGVESLNELPVPVVASTVTAAGRATVIYTAGTALFSRSANLPAPVFPAVPDPVDPTTPTPTTPEPTTPTPPGPTPTDPGPQSPSTPQPGPPVPPAVVPTKTVAPAKLKVAVYVLPSGKKCPAVAAATVDKVRTNLKVTKTKLRKKLACKVTGTVVLKSTVKPGTKVAVLITAKGVKRKAVQLVAVA